MKTTYIKEVYALGDKVYFKDHSIEGCGIVMAVDDETDWNPEWTIYDVLVLETIEGKEDPANVEGAHYVLTHREIIGGL